MRLSSYAFDANVGFVSIFHGVGREGGYSDSSDFDSDIGGESVQALSISVWLSQLGAGVNPLRHPMQFCWKNSLFIVLEIREWMQACSGDPKCVNTCMLCVIAERVVP